MNAGLSGLSEQVEALFASWTQPDAPGAAVIVVREDEVLHEGFFGLANVKTRRPLGPQDSFRLASLTKQFTALAIVILAEKGALTYDDDIRQILPEFSHYPQKITIRQLLHHSSGLEDFESLHSKNQKLDKDYPRSGESGRSDFEPQSKDVISLLARTMLRFTPGDEWEYSNSGYVVLAQVVEQVSARPYSDFVQTEIFQPLQMKNSMVHDDELSAIPNRVVGYVKVENEYRDLDYTPLDRIVGHDGIYSTVEDMVEWCRSFHRGEILARTALSRGFATGYLNIGANTGYGFGWFVGKSLGLDTVSHTGSWTGYRHLIVYYPQLSFTLLVLSNCAEFDDVSRSATACALARLYVSKNMILPREARVSSEILRKYAGRYEFTSGEFIDVRLEDGSLLVEPATLFPLRLIPESEVKFLVAGAEGDSYFFHTDEEDAVVGLTRHLSLFGYCRDAYALARKVG